MTPAHIKTTLAALANIATPAHLRAAPSTTMAASSAPMLIAGAAPQGAAPRAADPGFSWDDVVGEMNAQAGLRQPQAATPIVDTTHQAPAAAYTSDKIDWASTVAAVNAENGCTRPGANADPKLVATLAGGNA